MEFLFAESDKSRRFEVLGRLGEGSFGEVRLGYDTLAGEKVAIKYIRKMGSKSGIPKAVFREIQALQKFSGQNVNIVRLVDIFPEETNLCLVFEHVPSDLAEMVSKATDYLPRSHVKCLARMILEGLAFCHAHNIVHRDLKPSNILVASSGQIKIADFGLARTISGTSADGPLSHQVATRMYRAPELLFASRNYTFAVDVWAAGAVIGELFTLTPLFPGNNDIDQIFRVLQVMGSPTKECWPDVENLPDFHKLSFPNMNPMPLEVLMPQVDEEDIAFLRSMLVLDPTKRRTACGAANTSYFLRHPLPCPLSSLNVPLRTMT